MWISLLLNIINVTGVQVGGQAGYEKGKMATSQGKSHGKS